MTKLELLDQVKDVLEQRGRTHGNSAQQLSVADAIKHELRVQTNYYALTGVEREAIDNIVTKLARVVCGVPNMDCWVDIIGYAAIAGEARSKENG